MLSRSAASTSFRRSFHPILRETTRRNVSTSTDAYENVDVVIVGGGPAGLALASALGMSPRSIPPLAGTKDDIHIGSSPIVKDNLSVALIEAGDLNKIQDWSMPMGSFSNRASSLTNASQDFLKRMYILAKACRVLMTSQGAVLGVMLTSRGRVESKKCRCARCFFPSDSVTYER